MKHRLATLVVAGLAVAVVGAAAGPVKVAAVVNEGRVLASFNATDSWTSETRELLQFGQLVTFDYYIELKKPRMIYDATVANTNMTASAKLDTITGTYTVTRVRDRRMLKSEKRDQENDVRDWLTVFEPIELDPESPLKANNDYYIQVRLFKSPRSNAGLISLLPLGREDSSGRTAMFTYLR